MEAFASIVLLVIAMFVYAGFTAETEKLDEIIERLPPRRHPGHTAAATDHRAAAPGTAASPRHSLPRSSRRFIRRSSSRFADIIGACLMVVSHVAHAAPPPDADMSLAPWFHSLTIPNTGSSCCGAADCRNYPVVVASDGYRVQFRGQWLKVPPAVVQDRGDNPTGDYVTCIIDAAEPEVLCFIKAPRT